MKISMAKNVVKRILKIGEAVMLVGHAGVGKTSLIKEIGKETGRNVQILILSQMEPGDLIGLPDKGENITKFLKPEWWPNHGKSIIFLDEINRAHPLVRHAVMQLILDKRIHNHVLPDGTWVVAAMNPSDGYEVFEMDDPAFIDRFVWIWIENSPEEFIEYSKNRGLYIDGLEDIIVDFKTGERSLPSISPTPRSWERALKIARHLNQSEIRFFGKELFEGILGKDAGERFWNFLMDSENIVYKMEVEDILNLPKEERFKLLAKLSILIVKDPDKFFALVEKLHPEEGTVLLRNAVRTYESILKRELEKRRKTLIRILREELKRRVA